MVFNIVIFVRVSMWVFTCVECAYWCKVSLFICW